MKSGVRPLKKDHRDYSFHRTFGTAIPPAFPDNYNCDWNKSFPDQDADNLPEGCTGYTQSECCQDSDWLSFQPKYTYDKTLFMEGQPEGVGCDIRDSLKSTIIWGVSQDGTDQSAAQHKRAAYYVIELNAGLDWFDSFRNMLWANRNDRRSISVVSPWYSQWTRVGGVVSAPTDWTWVFGHNWKCCGWETINGVPYLIGKSWQGSAVGYTIFSREIIKKLMTINGTGAFLLIKEDPTNPEDVKLVRLTIIDFIASYLRYLLSLL